MIIVDKLYDPSNIKTVIFDIDNTITRWINVKDFLKKSLDNLGIPYSEESLFGLFKAMEVRELHALVSSESDEEMYSYFLEYYIKDLKKYGKSGKDLKDIMFELEPSQTFVSEETVNELNLLAQKYQLICYTNWFKNQAIRKLEKYGVRDLFNEIYSSEEMYVKHSKMGFVYLAYKYNREPDEIVHIGDSSCDVLPSTAAGLHSIYLDYDISKETITEKQMDLIMQSSATVTEFGDIRKVLTKKSTNIMYF